MEDLRPSRACCGLAPTAPAEDALRTIFVLSGRGEPVSTSALARHLQVSAPTVSSMLRRLEEYGLVDRTPDHHTTLTAHGAGHARHVVRRHRLLETFLVEVVGLAPDEVHTEADALEHAVSDRLLDRIDTLLGRPARDPHGDPIPRSGDAHVEGWGTRLADAAVGGEFRVERVQDWDGPALRHLVDLGVVPGLTLVVVERGQFGGPLWVRFDGRDHALGEPLTRLVYGREVRVDVPARTR
jgi:DtxR family transcriptional regulator, Mn-dependent transcriptional regulator